MTDALAEATNRAATLATIIQTVFFFKKKGVFRPRLLSGSRARRTRNHIGRGLVLRSSDKVECSTETDS